MPPSFGPEGGWALALALARGASVAALLSVFGTLVFRNVVAPHVFARAEVAVVVAIKRRLWGVAQCSVAAAVIATLAWGVLQAGDMADAGSVAQALEALPTVVGGTEFGHLMLARLAMLLVVAGLIGRRDGELRQRVALGAAAIATVVQAGHSHAFSQGGGPSLLLGCDMLHLLGAGGWLGGLVPLLLVVRDAPPLAGAIAARWFSPLGKLCIAALSLSAAYQGWVLVASIPGLVGTAYGWVVLGKIVLFGVLLGFAAANRYRFAPALLRADPPAAKRVLVRSILVQSCFGVVIVMAAAVLSELPPSVHEQPWWPFAQRISLAAVREDADFRREVLEAGLAVAGAIGVVVAALAWRRFRVVALCGAAGIAWFAVPHFDLLLVEAYPTSFYRSPTGFSAESIAAGAAVYAEHCAVCHGAEGSGDGTAAKSLSVPPADLTAGHLWIHDDGELFWWLSHGIDSADGGQAMPGFSGVLDEDQRWAAIDYIRAHNAGVALRRSGAWPQPVRAPSLQARCGGRDVSLEDLRGRFVRLAIGDLKRDAVEAGVVSIVAEDDMGGVPAGVCVASGTAVRAAYQIVTGTNAQEAQGMELLIDGEGWLRAVQRPGAVQEWDSEGALAAAIAKLRKRPVGGAPDAGMGMRMKMPM